MDDLRKANENESTILDKLRGDQRVLCGMSGGARAGCGRKKTKEGPTRKEKSQKRKEKAKLLAAMKECCDPVKAAAAHKEQRLATINLLPQELQPLHIQQVALCHRQPLPPTTAHE